MPLLIEGRGNVAPKPMVIHIAPGELALLNEAVAAMDARRGYSRRGDAWGRGYIVNPGLPGKVGELALCAFLNRRLGLSLAPDLDVREKGDGGKDVEVAGLNIQVKTQTKVGGRCLIRRVDGAKRLRPVGCDLLVFARFVPASREASLLGWIFERDVRAKGRLLRSPVGDHFNIEIPLSALMAMSRLPDEIKLQAAL